MSAFTAEALRAISSMTQPLRTALRFIQDFLIMLRMFWSLTLFVLARLVNGHYKDTDLSVNGDNQRTADVQGITT